MSLTSQIRRTTTDVDLKQRAGEFALLVRCLMGAGEGGLPQALALCKEARGVERVETVLRGAATAGGIRGLSKAATPMMTTDNTSALTFQTLSSAFLESLRHSSAIAAILADGGFIVTPFGSRVSLVTAAPTGSQVGEGQLKPITKLSVEAPDPAAVLKAVVLLVVSDELLRFGPLANTLIMNELQSALAVTFDRIAFQSLLADSTLPTQPSVGLSGSNAADDLAFLANSIQTSSRSKLYLVGAPDAVKSFALRHSEDGLAVFPDLGIGGGAIGQTPVLVSDGLDAGVMVAIDASRVAFSDNGVALDEARHASIQLDDAPSPGGPATSLWQQNQRGLRAERLFACQAIGPNAISYISGVGESA